MGFIKDTFRKIFRISPNKLAHSEQNFVKNESTLLFSRSLNKQIRTNIYLPPSYFSDKTRTYPVLFCNDGQDMEAVGLVSTLERLYARGRMREIIVFAFYPDDRMNEYGTAISDDYAGRGNKAEAYQTFLLREFMPYARRTYRLSDQRDDFAIAGFSLGGLSAFDTAWNYPATFGKVGVFSGALWWRSKAFRPDDPDADRIVHDYVQACDSPPKLRFWLQTGTKDETADRNNNGIIDSIDDTTDLIKILKEKDAVEGEITYLEVQDGEHNQHTWRQVLGDFLVWGFG